MEVVVVLVVVEMIDLVVVQDDGNMGSVIRVTDLKPTLEIQSERR